MLLLTQAKNQLLSQSTKATLDFRSHTETKTRQSFPSAFCHHKLSTSVSAGFDLKNLCELINQQNLIR